MEDIKLYKSPRKAIVLIAGCSIFFIPSIYFLLNEIQPKIIYWVSAGFFSLGYIVGLINLFDRRPLIILNSDGIWDRSLKFELIPWEDILDCYGLRIGTVKFICLVTNPALSHRKKTPKWVDNLNDSFDAQKFNLSIDNIKVKPENLLRVIKQLSTEPVDSRAGVIAEIKSKKLI